MHIDDQTDLQTEQEETEQQQCEPDTQMTTINLAQTFIHFGGGIEHLMRHFISIFHYLIVQFTLLLIHFDCFKCILFSLLPKVNNASTTTIQSTLSANVFHIAGHLMQNAQQFFENLLNNDNKCKVIIDNKIKLDNNNNNIKNILFCSANQQQNQQYSDKLL